MIKVFLRSLLVFFLVYLALFFVLSLSGSKKATAAYFTGMANSFMPVVLPKAFLVFEQDPTQRDDPNRIRVRLQSREFVDRQKQLAKQEGLKTIDLNFHSYKIFLFEFFVFPLLFFSALVLSTPAPWKRKLLAFFIGAGVLQVFLLFKTYFITLYHLQRNQVPGYIMSEFNAQLMEKVQLAFNNITAALIVATLIWGVSLFTKNDWKTLVGKLAAK